MIPWKSSILQSFPSFWRSHPRSLLLVLLLQVSWRCKERWKASTRLGASWRLSTSRSSCIHYSLNLSLKCARVPNTRKNTDSNSLQYDANEHSSLVAWSCSCFFWHGVMCRKIYYCLILKRETFNAVGLLSRESLFSFAFFTVDCYPKSSCDITELSTDLQTTLYS